MPDPDYSKVQQERIAARKKAKKQERNDKILVGVGAAVVFLVLLAVIVFLGGLLTLLAWNVGVVALVAACGGHVANIGFWTAVGINVALGVVTNAIKSALGRNATTVNNSA